MNDVIKNVLERKQDILNKTMEYEDLNAKIIEHNHTKEYMKLYNFFD